MTREQNPIETLSEIRSIMERSSRFISLSGFSGISAGLIAIFGAIVIWFFGDYNSIVLNDTASNIVSSPQLFLLMVACIVLLLALSFAIYFSSKKAKKLHLKFWDHTTKRVLINLMIPLISGGFFCIILFSKGFGILIAPSMLVFYGFALLNASHFTLKDIRYLGFAEIGIGLIALIFAGYGLLFWTLGFGLFHIVYGIFMYIKYDR